MDRLLLARHVETCSWQDDCLELLFCWQPQMTLVCCKVNNPDEFLCVGKQEDLMRNLHTTNLLHRPNYEVHQPRARESSHAPATPGPSVLEEA